MELYSDIKNLVKKYLPTTVTGLAVAYLIYKLLKPYLKAEESYSEKLEILKDQLIIQESLKNDKTKCS